MTNLQIEAIVWHKYPEEEPPDYGDKYVEILYTNVDGVIETFVDAGRYIKGLTCMVYVVAWAEMPKGWVSK